MQDDRLRGNRHKLQQERCWWKVRKNIFALWLVTHWTRLPRVVVKALSLYLFRTQPNKALSNLMWPDLLWAGHCTR